MFLVTSGVNFQLPTSEKIWRITRHVIHGKIYNVLYVTCFSWIKPQTNRWELAPIVRSAIVVDGVPVDCSVVTQHKYTPRHIDVTVP